MFQVAMAVMELVLVLVLEQDMDTDIMMGNTIERNKVCMLTNYYSISLITVNT